MLSRHGEPTTRQPWVQRLMQDQTNVTEKSARCNWTNVLSERGISDLTYYWNLQQMTYRKTGNPRLKSSRKFQIPGFKRAGEEGLGAFIYVISQTGFETVVAAFLTDKPGSFITCKNFKKTACEIFHDEATFHALRFKPVSKLVGLVSPCSGDFG